MRVYAAVPAGYLQPVGNGKRSAKREPVDVGVREVDVPAADLRLGDDAIEAVRLSAVPWSPGRVRQRVEGYASCALQVVQGDPAVGRADCRCRYREQDRARTNPRLAMLQLFALLMSFV